MNTKNSSILMLCIGLAAGMVIGYSFHDQKSGEQSFQRDRMEAALKSLPTKQSPIEIRLNEGIPREPMGSKHLPEIQDWNYPVLSTVPKVPSEAEHKDLIDQRFSSPQLDLR